jgi:transcription-repair coupling factor (superfamily II helicase)
MDLELRGAGSLLGGEQSGHLEALGFDLYTQMLERTVAELRGEEVGDEASVTLNLGVDVAIPEEYISDMGQRLRTYKRVSSARDESTLQGIKTETEDRYGRIPPSVERLFSYARLRRTAEELGLVSIDKTPDGIAVKFSEKARISPEKLGNFVAGREGSAFSPSGVLRLILTEDEQDNVLEFVRDVLLQIKATD